MGLAGRDLKDQRGLQEGLFPPKRLSAGKLPSNNKPYLPELGRPARGAARLLRSRSGQRKRYNCLLRISDGGDSVSGAELELASEAGSGQHWWSKRGEHKDLSSSRGDKGGLCEIGGVPATAGTARLQHRTIHCSSAVYRN